MDGKEYGEIHVGRQADIAILTDRSHRTYSIATDVTRRDRRLDRLTDADT